VAIDGEALTAAEVKRLLADSRGLVFIRGKWVEVDPERLQQTLTQFQQVERLASEQGLGFHEAMRLLAGAGAAIGGKEVTASPEWAQVNAGPWLAETLAGLRGPQGLAAVDAGPDLHATLRPYQQVGLRWLHLLSRLRLGACLADDMGLGKTIQVQSAFMSSWQNDLSGNTFSSNALTGRTAVSLLRNQGYASRVVSMRVSEQDVQDASRQVDAARGEAVAASTERSAVLSEAFSRGLSKLRSTRNTTGSTSSSFEQLGQTLNRLDQITKSVAETTGMSQSQVANIHYCPVKRAAPSRFASIGAV